MSDTALAEDSFGRRHNGPSADEVREMLSAIGVEHMDQLIAQTVPASIRVQRELALEKAVDEYALLHRLRELAGQN